eukprot:508180_1
MSISVSKYISYNSSTTTYTIKRKGCKIVCDSDIGEAIGSKSSCNTSKKATLSMLNEYYEIYGTERSKKYKTVDIKIEYNTVEEIIAAIKVFVLAHKQIPIDTIQLTDQFIIGEHVELNPNSTAEKLFDSVKQSLISGVPPNCYESKSDYIEDTDEKTDNSEQDVIGNDDLANLDGLEIRNVEQLSQHLEIDLEDQDESSDDDDDDDYIDPDF